MSDQVACGSCQAQNPVGAEFCTSCLGPTGSQRAAPAPLPHLDASIAAEAAVNVELQDAWRKLADPVDAPEPTLAPGTPSVSSFNRQKGSTNAMAAGVFLGGSSAICSMLLPGSHPVGWAAAAGFGALGVWGFLNRRSKPETLPNLAKDFGQQSLRELNGVQFVVRKPSVPVAPGAVLMVEAFFQNVMDQPREVRIRVEDDERGERRFPTTSGGWLGPGEIGQLRIPVAFSPFAEKRAELWLRPLVAGPGGVRVRHLLALPYEEQVTAEQRVAHLVIGRFIWGGGMPVRIPRPAGERRADWRTAALQGEWKTVWSPAEGQLEQARR